MDVAMNVDSEMLVIAADSFGVARAFSCRSMVGAFEKHVFIRFCKLELQD
jgi:hypothetical protein